MTFEEWWETEYRPTITDDQLCIRPLKLHDLRAAWQASRKEALEEAAKICAEKKLFIAADNVRALKLEAGVPIVR